MQNVIVALLGGAIFGALAVAAFGTGQYHTELSNERGLVVQTNTTTGALRLCGVQLYPIGDPRWGRDAHNAFYVCGEWAEKN